jgi:hypothetical protein
LEVTVNALANTLTRITTQYELKLQAIKEEEVNAKQLHDSLKMANIFFLYPLSHH